MKEQRNDTWQNGGVITALITPFRPRANGRPEVDYERFGLQIEHQIKAGVAGIVAVGTTGESSTLTNKEHIEVISSAVRFATGRISVIAGTGSNCTDEAIELTVAAEAAGADATLQVAPYYNKPSQEGLYRHFSAIADATALPVMLYNIPSRCGVEIAIETMGRLVRCCDNIVALKEAGWDDKNCMMRPVFIQASTDSALRIFAGNDDQILKMICGGRIGGVHCAIGVVSVISNIIPRLMRALVEAARVPTDDHLPPQEALIIWEQLKHFVPLLFKEGNPSGIKHAMLCAGLDSGLLRLPLVSPSRELAESIRWIIPQLIEQEVLVAEP